MCTSCSPVGFAPGIYFARHLGIASQKFIKKYNSAMRLPKAATALSSVSNPSSAVTNWIKAATRNELAIRKEPSLAFCDGQRELPLSLCCSISNLLVMYELLMSTEIIALIIVAEYNSATETVKACLSNFRLHRRHRKLVWNIYSRTDFTHLKQREG